MNPGELYHQHGVREQVRTRAEYGSKTIVLHIKTVHPKNAWVESWKTMIFNLKNMPKSFSEEPF